MSTHMTHEELTDLLLGSPTNAVGSHLRACEQCRRELEQMRGSMQAFRTAGHGLSESLQTPGLGLSRQFPRRPRIFRPWVFAAAAVASLVAVFGAYRISHRGAIQGNNNSHAVNAVVAWQAASQEEIARDNELMSQINSELAEDAPEPMQPLQWTASEVSSSNNKAR